VSINSKDILRNSYYDKSILKPKYIKKKDPESKKHGHGYMGNIIKQALCKVVDRNDQTFKFLYNFYHVMSPMDINFHKHHMLEELNK
jgi:hypothetical protein